MATVYEDLGSMWPVVLICGILIGMLIGMAMNGQDIKDLGQAICEEEYDLDYDSYEGNELRCKPKTVAYDGLRVLVKQDDS